jgi:hypothetical protein
MKSPEQDERVVRMRSMENFVVGVKIRTVHSGIQARPVDSLLPDPLSAGAVRRLTFVLSAC